MVYFDKVYCKLLEWMYAPSEGAVRFGPADVKTYQPKDWRNAFAPAARNSPLRSGTIRQNTLCDVDRTVSEEELTAVAKR